VKRHHVEKLNLLKFKQMLANEVSLLKDMDHPNVIKLFEYNLTGELVVKRSGKCIQIFFIVLELVEQGDLFDLISNGVFNEVIARFFFLQLVQAVTYLHETAGVCHRDLKPENVLLNSQHQIKIADFGLAINQHDHSQKKLRSK
jgi:serine/threonine-protein kinase Chk1